MNHAIEKGMKKGRHCAFRKMCCHTYFGAAFFELLTTVYQSESVAHWWLHNSLMTANILRLVRIYIAILVYRILDGYLQKEGYHFP